MFHHFGCVSWIRPGRPGWNFPYEHTTEFVPVIEPARLPGSYEEALNVAVWGQVKSENSSLPVTVPLSSPAFFTNIIRLSKMFCFLIYYRLKVKRMRHMMTRWMLFPKRRSHKRWGTRNGERKSVQYLWTLARNDQRLWRQHLAWTLLVWTNKIDSLLLSRADVADNYDEFLPCWRAVS